MNDYESYDALGLAELVCNGEVTPAELVEEAITRIEVRDPAINAVTTKLFERAREQAAGELPDGPFRGVPYLLKDLFIDLAGVPSTNGSRFFDGFVPDHNTEVVNRLEAAGFVFVGKTNTPEFGLQVTTESERLGPARNPWDTTRTTAGSSGGSAAAVAAGMVPAADGSDGGGSIRIPACRCGLFGLKPSRGRNPTGPNACEPFGGQAVEHAITRSVRDSAAILDAIHGPDAGAPYCAPTPKRHFLSEVGADPGKLRIGFFADPLLPGAVTPAVRSALRSTAALLGELGHVLIDARPQIDGEDFVNAFVEVVAGSTAADVEVFEKQLGRKARSHHFEFETWTAISLGRKLRANEMARSREYLRMTGRRIAQFMEQEEVDVILCPTMPDPPFKLGTSGTPAHFKVASKLLNLLGMAALVHKTPMSRKTINDKFAVFPYTPVFNATGQPSMSVPLSWSDEGLPIGMMFTAAFGEEALLLRLASQLESARPWRDKRPSAV